MAKMAHKLIGQGALVTGGANGIGWAICKELAQRGYKVALADVDATKVEARAAELGRGHIALPVDLLDLNAAAALPTRAATALGGLDIVVNNAGMTDTTGKTLIDLPEEAFSRLIALNLSAVEVISSAASDLLLKGGAIVNLASGAAYRPLALRGPYSATKAGVVALTKALAMALAPRGISVSAVAPGYTLTPLVEALAREGRVDLDSVARAIPVGRVAIPEDIAAVVGFLLGPDARVLSGETLVVDGGGLVGPAPSAVAPAPGIGSDGTLVLMGMVDDLVDWPAPEPHLVTDVAEWPSAKRLAGVIDMTALADEANAATALERARRTAITCAMAPNRAAAFSLVFVLADSGGARAAAARASVGMLARTLALEWAPAGLRVNTIIWRGETKRGLGALCQFLAGPGAGYITGQVVEAGNNW